MKADKLEKEFRDKLNQREINPSANSWDRLNAMLTVAEEKKPKRNYGWIYIAASIVGFILIGTVFFSKTEELIDVRRNNVVIENKKTEKPAKRRSVIPYKNQAEAIAVVTQKITTTQFKHQIKLNNQKASITENEIKQNELAEHSIINQKTEQSGEFKQNKLSTDELLAKALASKNEKPKSTVKVNASSLLAQVDAESEFSFREKVIKTIDKNYKAVKVAIATRNQEEIINQQ